MNRYLILYSRMTLAASRLAMRRRCYDTGRLVRVRWYRWWDRQPEAF